MSVWWFRFPFRANKQARSVFFLIYLFICLLENVFLFPTSRLICLLALSEEDIWNSVTTEFELKQRQFAHSLDALTEWCGPGAPSGHYTYKAA